MLLDLWSNLQGHFCWLLIEIWLSNTNSKIGSSFFAFFFKIVLRFIFLFYLLATGYTTCMYVQVESTGTCLLFRTCPFLVCPFLKEFRIIDNGALAPLFFFNFVIQPRQCFSSFFHFVRFSFNSFIAKHPA